MMSTPERGTIRHFGRSEGEAIMSSWEDLGGIY